MNEPLNIFTRHKWLRIDGLCNKEALSICQKNIIDGIARSKESFDLNDCFVLVSKAAYLYEFAQVLNCRLIMLSGNTATEKQDCLNQIVRNGMVGNGMGMPELFTFNDFMELEDIKL